MGFYCANHYADPRCYNNVVNFGDFCTACIESKRGWSTEANTGGDSTVATTQGSQQTISRDSTAQPATQPAYRNTSVAT